MSPSIIVHGDQYEQFRDTDLHALLSVMDYLASLDPAEYGVAIEVLAAWVASARDSGNNAIDLNLGLLLSPFHCKRMIALMVRLEDHISQHWPEGVPAEIGNRVREYTPLSHWPAAHILASSVRLRSLIERTVCNES